MTIDKKRLIELIDFGADIEFSFDGKDYAIFAWTDDGIVLVEKNTQTEFVYPNRDDFIQNCKIKDVPILDALPKIDITFHT